MKRLVKKYTIFLLLVVIVGFVYYISNMQMRNTVFGAIAGILCMELADKITNK